MLPSFKIDMLNYKRLHICHISKSFLFVKLPFKSIGKDKPKKIMDKKKPPGSGGLS
jgi:hypothetical protein